MMADGHDSVYASSLDDVSFGATVEHAIRVLWRRGTIVLYPTQTLYGLGGRASDEESVLRLARLKGREPGRLVVLCEDPPLPWAVARRLAGRFWPGPLSIVVPAWGELAPAVCARDGTVAVRPPCHPVAAAMVRSVGPLTSTSANLSGMPPISLPSALPFTVDAVVDVGSLPRSPPSSVVRGDSGEILREGAIPSQVIQACLA